MHYFNYEKIAREVKIPTAKMIELCQAIRTEFPCDDMMYELHLLRACMAIRDGYLSIEDAIPSSLKSDKGRVAA